SDSATVRAIQKEFARRPALYIADGHHRSAAAARVCQSRNGAGHSGWFLAVIFPHDQMRILPYNRVLRDLNDHRPETMIEKLDDIFVIEPTGRPQPNRKHELGLYLKGNWRTLQFRPRFTGTTDPIEQLDVTLLQKHVLAPLFGIDDPRTSTRINFVGGIRGTA